MCQHQRGAGHILRDRHTVRAARGRDRQGGGQDGMSQQLVGAGREQLGDVPGVVKSAGGMAA